MLTTRITSSRAESTSPRREVDSLSLLCARARLLGRAHLGSLTRELAALLRDERYIGRNRELLARFFRAIDAGRCDHRAVRRRVRPLRSAA